MTVVLALLIAFVAPLPARAQDTALVPVHVDGDRVRLAMTIYRPDGGSRLPTLVFNHGSTGSGTDPAISKLRIDFPALARFFG
jgi:hypothetical protein